MDLPSFIDENGIGESARLFKASYRAVAAWRKRDRLPRPAKARFIERRTRGHPVGCVTLAEIYGTP